MNFFYRKPICIENFPNFAAQRNRWNLNEDFL